MLESSESGNQTSAGPGPTVTPDSGGPTKVPLLIEVTVREPELPAWHAQEQNGMTMALVPTVMRFRVANLSDMSLRDVTIRDVRIILSQVVEMTEGNFKIGQLLGHAVAGSDSLHVVLPVAGLYWVGGTVSCATPSVDLEVFVTRLGAVEEAKVGVVLKPTIVGVRP